MVASLSRPAAALLAFALTSHLSVSGSPILPPPTYEYDYIIVGSGAGGLPLASALSASNASVLLLERGAPTSGRWGGTQRPLWLSGTNLTFYDVPALDNEIYAGKFSQGIYCDDVVGAIAGCVVGGGTAINAGLWWRPSARDWGIFPRGWGSEELVGATERVFERIGGSVVPSADGVLALPEGAEVVMSGLRREGWTERLRGINDAPDEKNRTYGLASFMYSNGERGGPMATYLVDAYQRPNFEMWTNTMVERVVRDGSRIKGVTVTSAGAGGKNGTIYARNVILSAGALSTPKILFRSGIGPRDQLEIVQAVEGSNMVPSEQWIDLPVGYNLADNINTDVVISHPNVTYYNFTAAYDTPIAEDAAAYLDNRTGILTQSSPNLNPLMWEAVDGIDGTYKQLQWTARVDTSLGIPNDGHTMTISNYLCLGQVARGRATIDENLNMQLTQPLPSDNEADREAIIQGLDSLRSALSKVDGITVKSPALNISSADYINSTAHAPVNHWLGTCKMGTDDGRQNGTAVVDPDTKVFGTDNLFVVDASIFPGLTTSNPSAMIVIAAEHAASRILALRL